MIQEFSFNTWYLHTEDYNIITRNGNRAEILTDSISINEGETFMSARIYYEDNSNELIRCKSNGKCISRPGKFNLYELDLFMEIYKPLTKFEEELSNLLCSASLSKKDAVERAIKAAPRLIEIIKGSK